MIEVGEGAYPVFFDYDNDGLKDMFIGNYGYYNSLGFEHKIALFKNIGTATVPQFELITRDYDGYDGTLSPLSSLGITNMIPTFGDMDSDGDADMIIGAFDGKMHYFKNIAPLGTMAHFVLAQANFKNSNNRSIDVGDFAAPQIVDIDNDGKNDLVIGSYNGKFAYYHNNGTLVSSIPSLDSVTHFFGRLKVNQPNYFTGYSYPFFFRQAGITKLLAGTQLGYLRLYDNIDGNLSGSFNLVDSTYLNIREGDRTAPFGADINNDGYMDLIIGNYQGGVAFFKGVSSLTTSNEISNDTHWSMDAFPNPAQNILNIIITNDNQTNYRIEFYNMLGQIVYSEHTVNSYIQIYIGNMKQGIYLCKISEEDSKGNLKVGALTKRIVVNH
jgi:hypothetical protein